MKDRSFYWLVSQIRSQVYTWPDQVLLPCWVKFEQLFPSGLPQRTASSQLCTTSNRVGFEAWGKLLYAVIGTLIISRSEFLLFVKVLCFEAVFSVQRRGRAMQFLHALLSWEACNTSAGESWNTGRVCKNPDRKLMYLEFFLLFLLAANLCSFVKSLFFFFFF